MNRDKITSPEMRHLLEAVEAFWFSVKHLSVEHPLVCMPNLAWQRKGLLWYLKFLEESLLKEMMAAEQGEGTTPQELRSRICRVLRTWVPSNTKLVKSECGPVPWADLEIARFRKQLVRHLEAGTLQELECEKVMKWV